jgi:hypothetical protein
LISLRFSARSLILKKNQEGVCDRAHNGLKPFILELIGVIVEMVVFHFWWVGLGPASVVSSVKCEPLIYARQYLRAARPSRLRVIFVTVACPSLPQ